MDYRPRAHTWGSSYTSSSTSTNGTIASRFKQNEGNNYHDIYNDYTPSSTFGNASTHYNNYYTPWNQQKYYLENQQHPFDCWSGFGLSSTPHNEPWNYNNNPTSISNYESSLASGGSGGGGSHVYSNIPQMHSNITLSTPLNCLSSINGSKSHFHQQTLTKNASESSFNENNNVQLTLNQQENHQQKVTPTSPSSPKLKCKNRSQCSSDTITTNNTITPTPTTTPTTTTTTTTTTSSPRPKSNCRRNPWGYSTYSDLIAEAIESMPERRATLKQIYQYIIINYEYFRTKPTNNSSGGWKNSIRHNLSLHDKFVKSIKLPDKGKSCYWMLNKGAKTTYVRKRAGSLDTKRHYIPKIKDHFKVQTISDIDMGYQDELAKQCSTVTLSCKKDLSEQTDNRHDQSNRINLGEISEMSSSLYCTSEDSGDFTCTMKQQQHGDNNSVERQDRTMVEINSYHHHHLHHQSHNSHTKPSILTEEDITNIDEWLSEMLQSEAQVPW